MTGCTNILSTYYSRFFNCSSLSEHFILIIPENFALHKQASQNSISNNGIANRLVDGNRDPYFGNNSCSETETATDGSYWEVDLGTEIYVTSVTITTRADDYWREGNRFSITVGNVLCASGQFVHDGKTTTYVCEKVEKDTHVRIDVLGLGKLSLCEVEVHGHPLNFYENTGKNTTTFHCTPRIGMDHSPITHCKNIYV